MPGKKNISIVVDYEVSIASEIVVAQEAHVSEDSVFQLVDLDAFVSLFKKTHPTSKDHPALLWNSLFGNPSSGTVAEQNPDVRYLTKESCAMILQYYRLFDSGIDFQNLPNGFFLTKNPELGGPRNILHYSDFVAKNHKIVKQTKGFPTLNQPGISFYPIK
jgi:hypothetical protein